MYLGGGSWYGLRTEVRPNGKLRVSHIHEDGAQTVLAEIAPKEVGVKKFFDKKFKLRYTFDVVKGEKGFVNYRLGVYINGKKYNNSYLWSIFLSTLGLMFHESVQPIHKVHLWLLFLFLDARLAIRHRNDALRLYGIGGNQRSLIPLACFIVRFRNDVHLQVLIRTFAVSVYVQIQTLISVAQVFHPKTDWLFEL